MGRTLAMNRLTLAVVVAAAVAGMMPARAEVKVAIDLALTGPTATIIAPHKRIWDILPKQLGGDQAKYFVVDDHGDPTEAVKAVRRLILEENVDVILAAGTTPICTAVSEVALEVKRPLICMSPVAVSKEAAYWVFSTPPRSAVLLRPLVDHMKSAKVRTLGFIGFADSLGEVDLKTLSALAPEAGIKLVAVERFERTATSVAPQVLKIISENPDAVYIGASGTPAVLPHLTLRENGYTGQIYHNNSILVPDFIRVGGKTVNGTIAVTSPLYVLDQLPDSDPSKKIGQDFAKIWDPAFGAQTRNAFAGYSYDAYLLLNQAVAEVRKTASPGTPEFRVGLRDALEQSKDVVGSNGVYTMTASDHNGLDARAVHLIRLDDGVWKLIQ
jgi:branched-chain amino acid transport system substrate-binding protein